MYKSRMKFFSIHNLLLLIAFIGVASATPTPAATAQQDTATFVDSWVENGLKRYRFYTNVQDMNRFVHAFQNCAGITSNWQAWQQDGHGVFDNSELMGAGDYIIACGIKGVTGMDCHELGFGCIGG